MTAPPHSLPFLHSFFLMESTNFLSALMASWIVDLGVLSLSAIVLTQMPTSAAYQGDNSLRSVYFWGVFGGDMGTSGE